jgi:hypothetical protein
MTARRRLLLVAALVTASMVALGVGAGAFSTASMDRPVELEVADHDRAFVTLWDPGVGSDGPPPRPIATAGLAGEVPVTEDGQSVRVVAVVNRFAYRSITVNATATSVPPGMDVGPFTPVTLGSGGSAGLEAAVDCGPHRGPASVVLSVRVSGVRMAASIEYTATVNCASPARTTPATTTAEP